MQCPVCKDVVLVMAERHGIEIDYCPKCRGIWLDRGELDKIIEHSLAQEASEGPAPGPARQPPSHQPPPPHHQAHPQPGYPPNAGYPPGGYPPQPPGYPPPHPGGHYPGHHDPYYYKRKKKWWDDLFDFD